MCGRPEAITIEPIEGRRYYTQCTDERGLNLTTSLRVQCGKNGIYWEQKPPEPIQPKRTWRDWVVSQLNRISNFAKVRT